MMRRVVSCSIVGLLFVVSIAISAFACLALAEFPECLQLNPESLSCHWTTLLNIVIGMSAPLVVFMVARGSFIFAYVYLFQVLHLICYVIFWRFMAPIPLFDLGGYRTVTAFVILAVIGVLSATYAIERNSLGKGRLKLLKRPIFIVTLISCSVPLIILYHWLTMGERQWSFWHVTQGRAALQDGDLCRAISHYTKAVGKFQGWFDYDALIGRGVALKRKRNFSAALDDINRAIALSPSSYAYYSRAAVNYEMGNKEAAEMDLRRVVQIADDAKLVAAAEEGLSLLQSTGSGLNSAKIYP